MPRQRPPSVAALATNGERRSVSSTCKRFRRTVHVGLTPRRSPLYASTLAGLLGGTVAAGLGGINSAAGMASVGSSVARQFRHSQSRRQTPHALWGALLGQCPPESVACREELRGEVFRLCHRTARAANALRRGERRGVSPTCQGVWRETPRNTARLVSARRIP
jgi:hypothetical protein